MKARQLERRAERLETVLGTLRALRKQADGRHLADAERAVSAELEQTLAERAEKACPQRARHTRNGTRAEWAEVRKAVRGVAEEQVTVHGATVGELVREELRAKGIRA